MNEQWIQQMREKMAGYRRPAPEVSWDEIDRVLAAAKAHKVRLFWLRRMAAAAVLLLIVGVGCWLFLPDEAELTRPTVASVESRPQPMENQGGDTLDLDLQPNQASGPMILAVTHRPDEVAWLDPESEIVEPTTTADHDTIHIAANEDEASPAPKEDSGIRPKGQAAPTIYPTDLRQQKHLDNRLTAKVYLSSTLADRQTTTNRQLEGVSYNPESIQKSYNHRQPVRFGLSMRYRLDDRWSVESGLTYTSLSSDITTTVNGMSTMTEQHLNYIGLPLNIGYELWRNRHFGLYVTAGSAIEKRLDASPWQFSLSGAAGAEYKLTDVFSLYAEPGLGYYFKDGSSTPTIYQVHPFRFNLSLGLRFNLK